MEPIHIVEKYFQAFGAGDLPAILELLHEDVVWNVAGAVHVSTVGLLQGKERIRRWMESFPENFQPLDFAIEKYFAQGEDVVVTGRFRHRIRMRQIGPTPTAILLS